MKTEKTYKATIEFNGFGYYVAFRVFDGKSTLGGDVRCSNKQDAERIAKAFKEHPSEFAYSVERGIIPKPLAKKHEIIKDI